MFTAGVTGGAGNAGVAMATADRPLLMHVEGGAQTYVHALHAGGAGEGAHQPIVCTLHVVVVHTREEPDWLSNVEFHHAYWTPGNEGGRISIAGITKPQPFFPLSLTTLSPMLQKTTLSYPPLPYATEDHSFLSPSPLCYRESFFPSTLTLCFPLSSLATWS